MYSIDITVQFYHYFHWHICQKWLKLFKTLLFLFKKLLTACIPDLGYELSFSHCTLHTAIAGRTAQCHRWRSLGFNLVWLNRWQTTTVMLMSLLTAVKSVQCRWLEPFVLGQKLDLAKQKCSTGLTSFHKSFQKRLFPTKNWLMRQYNVS